MAVAALRGDKVVAEMAETFDIQPDQIAGLKAQFLERSTEVFGVDSLAAPAPWPEKLVVKTSD